MISPDALASLIASLPDPAFLKDRQHRWILVNAPLCELLGLPAEDILGRTDAEIFSPTLAIQFSNSDDHVLATRRPVQTPWRASRDELLAACRVPRRGFVEARSHKCVVLDHTGDPHVLGIVRDVSETRSLEDSLARARDLAHALSTRRRDFIASLARTLQEPLQRMREEASTMQRLPLSPEASRLARSLESSTHLLLDLVHDLFDLVPEPARSQAATGAPDSSWNALDPTPSLRDGEPSSLQTTAGLRVLVVEDNRTNQFILRQQLEKLGCASELAEDGEQALEHLERSCFDIVLMDCQMPIMDGFEATRRWRGIEAERGIEPIPIVAVTTLALQSEKDECLVAGMDAVLPKPLRLATLEQTLLRWTRKQAI